MNQRQCVILKGDIDGCLASSETLLSNFNNDKLIFLSNCTDSTYKTISQKQAQQQLGKEFDAVIFDALDNFNADSFGAIVGTIKAGGALIVFLPSNLPDTLWLQRFNRLATDYARHYQSFHLIQQGEPLPTLTMPKRTLNSLEPNPTPDQRLALTAILKVVHGHRRRPLVLSSDRGRGKSAVLGMAAADLIRQGKQSIIVTAPSLATVDAVFEHAARLLPDAILSKGLLRLNDAEISFIAPDALIESDKKADLLLVDEAAAIPVPMLEQLLHQFSRIVFATTLHGYEGTGFGFAIRFKKILGQHTPHWHAVEMMQAIRWLDNDRLEAFSFETLLLDAQPVKDTLIQHCQPSNCIVEKIDRRQLAGDETSLRELFGLMVLAHYRTRPSDLQLMLDREEVSVYVMRYQGHIVASAWLVNEGRLDDELATAVFNGTRRLKGHLLPQSLLAHIGVAGAGALDYQRIIRIAVHPVIQQRGIGHTLLNTLIKKPECDIVGTSFAVSVDLLGFWSKATFLPVRLGLQQDEVSGSHSVMMVQALSPAGEAVVAIARQRFQEHWFNLVAYEFKRVDPLLIIVLSALIPARGPALSSRDKQEIAAFCQLRSYESCRIALTLWLTHHITQPHFLKLSTRQQQLSVMVILQQREWVDIAKRLNFSGKNQLINALRDVVALLNSPHQVE